MDVIKIAVMGLIAAILAVVIRQQRPELGMLIAIAAGVLILTLLFPPLQQLLTQFQTVADQAQVSSDLTQTALKICGIALVVEFAAQACRDSGEDTIAQKVELSGKVLMLVMALPVLLGILDVAARMLGSL